MSINVKQHVINNGVVPATAPIRKQILYNPGDKVDDYLRWAKQRVRNGDDMYIRIAPEGSGAAYGSEVVFRINGGSYGARFLECANLCIDLSSLTTTDAAARFNNVTALSLIENVQLYVGGTQFDVIDDTAPLWAHIQSINSDEDFAMIAKQLNYQSTNTPLVNQAQTDGVFLVLDMSILFNFLEKPLPIWKMNGNIEFRIRFKPLAQCIITTDAAATGNFRDCYMRCNFLNPGYTIVNYVEEEMARNGAWTMYNMAYRTQKITVPNGSSTINQQIPGIKEEDVVLMYFLLRSDTDLAAKTLYTFRSIDEFYLESKGQKKHGLNDPMKDQEYKKLFVDEYRFPGAARVVDEDIYAFSWSHDLDFVFKNVSVDYHGSEDFTGDEPTLQLRWSSALTGQHQVSVLALCASFIMIRADGTVVRL